MHETRKKRALLAAVLAIAGAGVFGSASQAAPTNPFNIDGVVPDVGATEFLDGFGSASELGPVNASGTKLGKIHNALPPMLASTNPNAPTDLRRVWIDTENDPDENSWLYFGWERDSNNGTGVIMYEFQKSPEPENCDYDGMTQAQLIASCNPWENRQPGDFVIVWDQQGNTSNIILRTWTFDDTNPDNDVWDGPVAEPLVLSVGRVAHRERQRLRQDQRGQVPR